MLLFSGGNKTVINITTGEKIGYLKNCDLEIDEKDGRIIALILPKSKLNALFTQQEDFTEVPWGKIRKIGTDAILVEL